MIIVKDHAALKLINPTIDEWDIDEICRYPQAINYIDCSLLTGFEWYFLISHPQFEELCTKYNGWDKMDGADWSLLLNSRPQFEDLCTEYNGWDKMEGGDWDWLLNKQPQYEKYKK